jgi:hypothetical protein
MTGQDAPRMSHGWLSAASEAARENAAGVTWGIRFRRAKTRKLFFMSKLPQRFHFSSTGFPHHDVRAAYRRGLTVQVRPTTLTKRMKVIGLIFALLLPLTAHAQQASLLYRVFLLDGSALASYGEWARVDGRLVFSMPVSPGEDPDQLHLVSIASERVDWVRTEQYAQAVRAVHYGAHYGEEDFARLSADVARILNDIALVKDPTERLVAAERARRSLADWPAAHYGYRAKEVHEIVGTLDEVINGLRASAGLGHYDLALMATTPPPPAEALLAGPDHGEIVQQLMLAATLVDTPAEKVSLLHTVVGVIDRAVGLLPDAWAAAIRASALGSIADEQKVDAAYVRLRELMLTAAARHAALADVRAIERLRNSLPLEDERLGKRRRDEIMALSAAIEAHLAAAYQLRLAQDQWMLRLDRLRAYQRSVSASITALTRVQARLDDIRALAGPAPWRLRPLADVLGRETRVLSRIDPPAELSAIHALFRSASELALSAARLRLDAVETADLELARRASSAAAGSLMLLSKAKMDLDAALRPPMAASEQ